MNWALLVFQMISMMEYEERGRVAAPTGLEIGPVLTQGSTCTIRSVSDLVKFNEQLMKNISKTVSWYSHIPLKDYYEYDFELLDGYATLVGDLESEPANIAVQCTEDMINLTTVAEPKSIGITYNYLCSGEQGMLKASIIRPKMKMVILQATDSNRAYTYGFYPDFDLSIDGFELVPEPRIAECKTMADHYKHAVADVAYEEMYFVFKEILDDSNINLRRVISWS